MHFSSCLKGEKSISLHHCVDTFFLILFFNLWLLNTFKMDGQVDRFGAFLIFFFFFVEGGYFVPVFTFMSVLAVRSNVHHSNGEY